MTAICPIVFATIKEFIRRKDFYVLLILFCVLLTISSMQNFFQIENVSRYVRDVGYSLTVFFSFLIAVTVSAGQLPREIENKTVYPLLAKPISRRMVVFSKFCASAAVSVLSFLLFFIAFLAFDVMKTGGLNPLLFAQAAIFGTLFLCMVCAFVIFLSTFMTFAANITVSILTYLFITGFSDSLRDFSIYTKGAAAICSEIVYYLIPHFDFFNIRIRLTHEWGTLPLWVIASVGAYTVTYSFFLLYFAGVIFGRKKL
ncbi:MAG: ABC transporter permease subunit [Candidatus Omnitrophica bacterium]|nr:ABC transporter permease subunit [Candidatus Omnitrophota bacterium]